MKRILIIVAVLLTLLSGCANNTVKPPTETETVNDSTTDTFPQVEKETTSSQAVSQESSVNIDSLEESTQDTDESKTVQTEASSPKQTVPDTKVEEKKSPCTPMQLLCWMRKNASPPLPRLPYRLKEAR